MRSQKRARERLAQIRNKSLSPTDVRQFAYSRAPMLVANQPVNPEFVEPGTDRKP